MTDWTLTHWIGWAVTTVLLSVVIGWTRTAIRRNFGVFARELRVFDENLHAWLLSGLSGKWVAIRGSVVLPWCDTFEQAFLSGQAAFGSRRFLIRQVMAEQRVETITRVHL